MINPFYNYVSGVPAAQTRGTSSGLRAEFALIQAGFDTVNATLIAEDAWETNNTALTGIPTAPTAPSGTSTNQLATTSFVAALAMNAALPGQAGATGLEITSNGSSAVWGVSTSGAIAILNFIGY